MRATHTSESRSAPTRNLVADRSANAPVDEVLYRKNATVDLVPDRESEVFDPRRPGPFCSDSTHPQLIHKQRSILRERLATTIQPTVGASLQTNALGSIADTARVPWYRDGRYPARNGCEAANDFVVVIVTVDDA